MAAPELGERMSRASFIPSLILFYLPTKITKHFPTSWKQSKHLKKDRQERKTNMRVNSLNSNLIRMKLTPSAEETAENKEKVEHDDDEKKERWTER